VSDESVNPKPLTREEEFARKAARLVKKSKPQLKRAIEATRPRAEAAGREAARYAREHEAEIKAAALKLAQARLGPLGAIAGTLANGPANPAATTSATVCVVCGTENPPASNFCNECGNRLASAPKPS
jgi:hypothetical protein